MREVQNVLGTLSFGQAVGRKDKDRGRDRRGSKDVVRHSDPSEGDVGRGGLQARAEVAQAIAQGLIRPDTVCLCCGTWFEDGPAALPCGAAWTNFADRTDGEEEMAWRHIPSHSGRLYGCPECGAVFVESGELHRKGRPLSLLSGVRVSPHQKDDDE